MADNGAISQMVKQSAQSRFRDDEDDAGRGIANQIEYLSNKEPHSKWVIVADRSWFTSIELKFIELPPLMKTKIRLMVKMGWLANRLAHGR